MTKNNVLLLTVHSEHVADQDCGLLNGSSTTKSCHSSCSASHSFRLGRTTRGAALQNLIILLECRLARKFLEYRLEVGVLELCFKN